MTDTGFERFESVQLEAAIEYTKNLLENDMVSRENKDLLFSDIGRLLIEKERRDETIPKVV